MLGHFKGLIHYQKEDTNLSNKIKGMYIGKESRIRAFLDFFNFYNYRIINKNAFTLKLVYFKK